MLTGLWANLDFFELKCALLLFCLLFFLGPLILEPAVIHYFTNRGTCIWRNLHQVKTKIICYGNGFIGGNDTDLVPLRVDYPDLFCSYISIDINFVRSVCPICTFRISYTSTS